VVLLALFAFAASEPAAKLPSTRLPKKALFNNSNFTAFLSFIVKFDDLRAV
jgi:hypothetical protein